MTEERNGKWKMEIELPKIWEMYRSPLRRPFILRFILNRIGARRINEFACAPGKCQLRRPNVKLYLAVDPCAYTCKLASCFANLSYSFYEERKIREPCIGLPLGEFWFLLSRVRWWWDGGDRNDRWWAPLLSFQRKE